MSNQDIPEIEKNWQDFCNLLWFCDDLGMWVDVSKMGFGNIDLDKNKNFFDKAISSMINLENGAYANIDENRQVGHYWLRNSKLSPSETIRNKIETSIESIEKFGENVISGNITNSNKKRFTDVFWIGIGGSSLGPLLVIEALQNFGKGLKFHFLDNVDTDGIKRKFETINSNLDTTLFVVVSKSGGTPEPKLGMEQAINFLEDKGLSWNSQAIAITMENSDLFIKASSEKWLKIFDLPDWVGGRTSITGAVGLLPMALAGLNIRSFLRGASLMDKHTRSNDFKNNPASILAYSWLKVGESKGLKDMVVLPYKDSLQVFSRYLQQLVMESLGKKNNRNGVKVNQGIAVYGNKGSTDQHAYVQQLRDGIDNFFATFIEVLQDSKNINKINNKNPGDYLSGFLHGTRSALSEGNRKHLTITMKKLNEESLGALVALFERSVGLYAEIININAYDQPGVEAGKKAASKLLKLQTIIENILSNGKISSVNELYNEIPESDMESIFFILRHLVQNDNKYSVSGNWSNPSTLRFQITK